MQHLTDREIHELADKKVRNNTFNRASQHLMECSICSEHVKVINELSRSIKRIELERPSKDFTSQVIRKIGIKEAPSFVWKVLTNLAPLIMLTIVLVVIVGALQVSGVSNNQEVTQAIESARSTYSSVAKQVTSVSAFINSWTQKLLPFAFAGNSTSLTIFLLCFFSAIALLDKHLFVHFFKRRQTT